MRCAVKIVIVCFLGFVHGWAQGPSDPAAKPIRKCWELSGTVVSQAGISADKSQGYFVDANGRLVAVELATGTIAWAADFGGIPISEIALTASSVVLASRSGGDGPERRPVSISSFTKTTGLPIWRVDISPAVRHYLEATEAGLVSVAKNGEIRLLSETGGQTIWKTSAFSSLISKPQIANGRLQLASGPKSIQEFSISNGRLNWAANVQLVPSSVGIPEGDGSVYIDEKGSVFSVDRKGSPRWKFKAGGRVIYLKSVGENVLVGSTDNFVYFMSADNGNLIWKRRLSGRVASGGVIGDSRAAFTVVGDRSAFVIELKDGRVVNRISLDSDEDAFLMTPIRANGMYLLAATAKALAAFSSSCGNEKSGDRAPLS